MDIPLFQVHPWFLENLMNMLEMGAKKHLQDPFGNNGKCRFYMDLLRKSEILMVTGILGWGASRETCQKPSTE